MPKPTVNAPPIKSAVRPEEIKLLTVVDCQEEKHQIAITFGGRLVLMHHDKREHLLDWALRKANLPAQCVCMAALRNWRAGVKEYSYRYQLPEFLRDESRQVNSLSSTRSSTREKHEAFEHEQVQPTFSRWSHKIELDACKAFESCVYRRGTVGHVKTAVSLYRSAQFDAYTEGKPSIGVDVKRTQKEHKPVIATQFSLRLPLGWYTQIHRRNLATVEDSTGDRFFTFAVLRESEVDGCTYLLLGKQSRGYQVVPTPALYNKRAKKVTWL